MRLLGTKTTLAAFRFLVAAGGVARATEAEVYKTLFPRLNPSLTARLGVAAESTEIDRILGELAKLPPDSPLRVSYEKPLTDAEALLKVTSKQSDQATTSFALQRSSPFKVTRACRPGLKPRAPHDEVPFGDCLSASFARNCADVSLPKADFVRGARGFNPGRSG